MSAPARHACAECFGPRSRYAAGPFCVRCERKLFGRDPGAYAAFVRGEAKHQSWRRRRAAGK